VRALQERRAKDAEAARRTPGAAGGASKENQPLTPQKKIAKDKKATAASAKILQNNPILVLALAHRARLEQSKENVNCIKNDFSKLSIPKIKEAITSIQEGVNWLVDITTMAAKVSSSLGCTSETTVQKLRLVQMLLNQAQGAPDRTSKLELLVEKIRPIIEAYKDRFWATASVAIQNLQECQGEAAAQRQALGDRQYATNAAIGF
jgi:hypothetical protein